MLKNVSPKKALVIITLLVLVAGTALYSEFYLQPELAENEKILATPTLVRVLPPPLRKVIGDLSNREKVLLGLDLVSHETNNQ